jgi:hypothetical protein
LTAVSVPPSTSLDRRASAREDRFAPRVRAAAILPLYLEHRAFSMRRLRRSVREERWRQPMKRLSSNSPEPSLVIAMAIENPRQSGPVGNWSDEDSGARIGRLLQGARSAATLSHKLALLDIEAQHRLSWHQSHFNPNQPRVPAGHRDGGQWTRQGGGAGIRLAARDKSIVGALLIAALHAAMLTIEAYRSKNGLRDLFDGKIGTVTWTRLDGKDIFGSNSKSPTYTNVDRAAAEAMRRTLLAKYPDVMKAKKIGQMPNDAVFHAETTILLRAARENGGTLAGRMLEIYSDREMCNNCEVVLPKVALELGNPAVTFIDKLGRRFTMRDGN